MSYAIGEVDSFFYAFVAFIIYATAQEFFNIKRHTSYFASFCALLLLNLFFYIETSLSLLNVLSMICYSVFAIIFAGFRMKTEYNTFSREIAKFHRDGLVSCILLAVLTYCINGDSRYLFGFLNGAILFFICYLISVLSNLYLIKDE